MFSEVTGTTLAFGQFPTGVPIPPVVLWLPFFPVLHELGWVLPASRGQLLPVVNLPFEKSRKI